MTSRELNPSRLRTNVGRKTPKGTSRLWYGRSWSKQSAAPQMSISAPVRTPVSVCCPESCLWSGHVLKNPPERHLSHYQLHTSKYNGVNVNMSWKIIKIKLNRGTWRRIMHVIDQNNQDYAAYAVLVKTRHCRRIGEINTFRCQVETFSVD